MRKARLHCEAMDSYFDASEGSFTDDGGCEYKQLEIFIKRTNSRIIALPANPSTARGHSANLVLDEFAWHKDSSIIWAALFPTVTRGFKLRIISTPQGRKNKFHDIWTRNARYSKHKTDIYLAIEQGLVIYGEDEDVPLVGMAGADFLREALDDEEAWAQEYECKFVDEATAWLTYELIGEAEDARIGFSNDWTDFPHGRYAGFDVGRKRHRSVYWSFERVADTLWTRTLHVMNNISFTDQQEWLVKKIQEDRLHRICVDASGLGMQLAETLKSKFPSIVEMVSFTNPVKENMAILAKQKFEDGHIRIPVDRSIREDLHSIRKTTTITGMSRYDADSTKEGHGDRFWAMALAVVSASQPSAVPRVLSGGRLQTEKLLVNF